MFDLYNSIQRKAEQNEVLGKFLDYIIIYKEYFNFIFAINLIINNEYQIND